MIPNEDLDKIFSERVGEIWNTFKQMFYYYYYNKKKNGKYV